MKKIIIGIMTVSCLFYISACKNANIDSKEKSSESIESSETKEIETSQVLSTMEITTEAPPTVFIPPTEDETSEPTRFPARPNIDENPIAEGEEFIECKVDKIMYVTTKANLRPQPSDQGSKVTTVAPGTRVRLVAYNNNWSRVIYSGKEVYISSALLTDVEPTE